MTEVSMGLHVENIKRGEWLAITASREGAVNPSGEAFTVEDRLVTGLPLQVLAISPPFVACRSPDGAHFTAIDARDCSFSRVAPEYVEAFQRLSVRQQESADGQPEPEQPTSLLACPACGHRLAKRRISSGRWEFMCRECGFPKCQK